MKTNDELQRDVMAEIKWDPKLHDVHTQIGVSAKDGVVTLFGLVDSYPKRLAAERAAQRVHGVKVVASDIEVKIAGFGKKTDTEIAEAVKNALRWNSPVQDDKIEVKVDNGWIFLDGEADWEYQRSAAVKSVENLVGVRGVSNKISLKPNSIDVIQIKRKIAEAFHRSATIDSSAITIETEGHQITLRGTVSSYAEREEAERVAWSFPGVYNVDNNISIKTDVYV